MQLGLVTYNWGKDWDLPTLLKNCEAAGFSGVELRSTHKHGVEPSLNERQRAEVAMRFADSPVQLVGLGTACEYHSPDPAVLKRTSTKPRTSSGCATISAASVSRCGPTPCRKAYRLIRRSSKSAARSTKWPSTAPVLALRSAWKSTAAARKNCPTSRRSWTWPSPGRGHLLELQSH